ncbi:hypothetical protein G9A89_018245 [Geosiphon pyriformis]|nr:hypothetical protein G9A89_018245 [Geosiphon pyriformis]
MSVSSFKIACIQLAVTANKSQNLQRAKCKILEAAQHGAKVVVLPECFNSPYGTQYFSEYAENIPKGESVKSLSETAKEANVYLIGGSIPEREEATGKLYNTCTVFNPEGTLIAQHRKVHLFDIDIPGKIRFQESEILSPGSALTHFDTIYGKFGVAICYDMRFPEMAMIAARKGACFIFISATKKGSGIQIFVATCSPARDMEAKYHAGEILATIGHEEAIIYADIELEKLGIIRGSIPITMQRRFDLYSDIAAFDK